MLTEDPPMPYDQIGAISANSIGPRRSRCLDKLRHDPALAALITPAPRPPEANHPDRYLRGKDDQPIPV